MKCCKLPAPKTPCTFRPEHKRKQGVVGKNRFCRPACGLQSHGLEAANLSHNLHTNGFDPSSGRKTTASGEVLLELRNVHKSFGEKKILKGASFKIYRGEAVGIIGASGSGKSTTLRLMAGLLVPDQGEIMVEGSTRSGLLADTDTGDGLRVGMVFQTGALFDSLTVGQNVGFILYEHSHLSEREIQQAVRDCLAKVGLQDVEGLYPSQLSGGMRKRVALARAIISDHKVKTEQVLMYDEPTAGLDPVASTVVEDLMRSMHATNNNQSKVPCSISSYIVVTHQKSTIERAVDRLIFLHNGVVAWEGTKSEFQSTEEPIVRQFVTGSLDGPIKYV